MSDLQQFAAAVGEAWRADNPDSNGPVPVSDLLDRVFSYAVARRKLGIDVSEDYEAMVLRLVAGHEGFAETTPAEAAELARVTMEEKLPDLSVLQLLRGAQLTLTPSRSSGSVATSAATAKPAAAPAPPKEARWAKTAAPASPPAVSEVAAPSVSAPTAPMVSCWSCASELPSGRSVKFCTQCGADQRPPVCAQCPEPLERNWKHCPECGQRVEPTRT